MKTSATNRRLRLLLTAIADGTLIPRPEFQRRLVWTNRDKLKLVETVLEGYPFPEIYIAAGTVDPDTGKGTELLVDGQQRITTLFQYFKGSQELRVPKGFPAYSSLSEPKKVEFLEYEVVVRDVGKLEIDAIKNIFTRINSTNYPLNAMETHNARFDGEFKRFGEKVAEHQFFETHRTFSNTDVRRMQDVRYCLSLAVAMLSTYFNRDIEMENYLERYNEEFSAGSDLMREMERTFSFVNDMAFVETSRAWKKVDLYSLLVETHRGLFKRKIDIGLRLARDRLNNFYDQVDQLVNDQTVDNIFARYHRAALQATNDRGNRITRGEIIQSLLDPTYSPRFQEHTN